MSYQFYISKLSLIAEPCSQFYKRNTYNYFICLCQYCKKYVQ